ncbi:MAG: hypothetical protein ACRDZR_03195 [Acidimicrobiales bacterium]
MTIEGDTDPGVAYQHLASFHRCSERITAAWSAFSARRADRLRQGLFDAPVEKVAEGIVEDLLTGVLDWPLADVNPQIGRADFVLSQLGVKHLVLEVKRPGSLAWHRSAVEAALDQARRYAADQKVGAVAVSDGSMLYAADVVGGGLRSRVYVDLGGAEPPIDLWWISVHGIYRSCPSPVTTLPAGPPGPADASCGPPAGELLQQRYHLPARCFAYVGVADQPSTWKLPYLLADGQPDLKRLPKAIQSILSNYRGVKVSIPREAVPDVLVRLGQTVSALGRMPCQDPSTAEVYAETHDAVDQFGRLGEIGCCP